MNNIPDVAQQLIDHTLADMSEENQDLAKQHIDSNLGISDKESDPYLPTHHDLEARLKLTYTAAQKLIHELKGNESNNTELELIENIYAKYKDQINANTDITTGGKILRSFTKEIANELKKLEKQRYSVTKSAGFKDNWYEELRNKEIEILSTTPRETKINLYADDQGGYILNVAIPYSNVSSLDRFGRDEILPNWFKDISYHVDKAGHIISHEVAHRSASVDPFGIADLGTRHEQGLKIAQNEFRQYVVDNILSNIENIKENNIEHKDLFAVNFFNMGLVSNVSEETKHVESAYKIYKQLKETDFCLTEKQQEQITLALQNKGVNVEVNLKQKIDTSNIILMNFGCNVVRGFDQNGLQDKINKDACQKITGQLCAIEINNPKLSKLLDALNKQLTIAKWREARTEYLAELTKMEVTINKTPAEMAIYKKLHAYVGFMDLCLEKQPVNLLHHNEDEQKNSYLRQVTAVHMAELLGMTCRINCKSGKDRTGAFFAAKQAAQITNGNLMNDEKLLRVSIYDSKSGFGEQYRDVFWNNFVNCAKHTTGRKITTDNCWGANGLQAQNQTHIYPENMQIAERINAITQDAYARIHRLPYEKRKPITNRNFSFEQEVLNMQKFSTKLITADDCAISRSTLRHIARTTMMNTDIREGTDKIVASFGEEYQTKGSVAQVKALTSGVAQLGLGVVRKVNLPLKCTELVKSLSPQSTANLSTSNLPPLLSTQKKNTEYSKVPMAVKTKNGVAKSKKSTCKIQKK